MGKPIISICIPTFNRASFLNQCLDSIVSQFNDQSIAERVEIMVLDNLSADNTESMVKGFSSRHRNVLYFKDSEPRKIAPGIVKAASLGTGEYIWIFSDDDLLAVDALKKILIFMKNGQADLILLNVDSFIENNRIHKTNLFKESESRFLKNRSEFWGYLNNKFYYDIDYFTTYCSNWILKKNYFDKTKQLFKVYNKQLDLFPFPSLVFYSDVDFSTFIVAESLVKFRADNASWVRTNPLRNFFYADRLWRHHYNYILFFNKYCLPSGFAFKVYVKYLLKIKDFLFLLIVLCLRKLGLFNLVRNVYKKVFTK